MERATQTAGDVQTASGRRAPETAGASPASDRALPMRSAVPPAGVGVPGLTPHGAARLQRLAGNQAVLRLLRPAGPAVAPPAAAPVAGPTLQRKVMIKQVPIPKVRGPYRHKQASSQGAIGTGPRNVGAMIADDPVRYFESKAELYGYARRTTDRIGYVPSAEAWVRLPNELTVMGEEHSADPNVSHIVTAVGTNRFMHEAFTAKPENLTEADEVVAALDARAESHNPRFGVAQGGQARHYAEDFYPKVMRGLTGIYSSGYRVVAAPAEKPLLRMAILDAKRLVVDDPEAEEDEQHFRTYLANRRLFDETAEHLVNGQSETSPLSQRMSSTQSSQLWDNFLAEYSQYAYEQIAASQERMPMADKQAFTRTYDATKGNYQNAAMMKAEKARDLSMYQHIKAARAQGYLLYGLGYHHHDRMADLLDEQGIKHSTVASFILAQKAAHPQE